MRPRHAVLLTPSKSSPHIQLLPRQHHVRVNALDATLMVFPASVANKRLTVALSPLDATLTKTIGGSPLRSTPLRTLRLCVSISLHSRLTTQNLHLTTANAAPCPFRVPSSTPNRRSRPCRGHQ